MSHNMKRPCQQPILQHRDDPAVDAVVPGSSKRVVLISSKSRGSDWDLTAINNNKEELHDSNNTGMESEDSGFQVDLVDSSSGVANKADQCDVTTATPSSDMIISQKVFFFSYLKLSHDCNLNWQY